MNGIGKKINLKKSITHNTINFTINKISDISEEQLSLEVNNNFKKQNLIKILTKNKKDRNNTELQIIIKWLQNTELSKKLKNDMVDKYIDNLLIFTSFNLDYEQFENEKFIFHKGLLM